MRDHLQRHQLERLASEDPAARIRPVLRVHVSMCDHCQTRLRALHTAKLRFLDAYPAREFARITYLFASPAAGGREPGDWTRELRRAVYAGLVAVFAVAFLWYGHEAAVSWVHAHGGASFHLVVTHDGLERRLEDGGVVHPGDRVAFAYSLEQARHLLLLGVDDTGVVRRYFPVAGAAEAAPPLPAAEHATLTVSLPVDSRTGEERLYALFSEEPLAESDARAAVSNAAGEAWSTGRRLEETPSLDLPAQAISVWFRREALEAAASR
jgi:hypothetical protein